MQFFKIIAALFLAAICTATFGQTTNVKQGLWSDQTVWNNNKIPTDTSTIILNFDIAIDINAACRSLNTNGHNVTVNSGSSFTIITNTVTDFDGNVYNTVTIGTQVWMKENLKVTRYRDGSPIPNLTDDTQWRNNVTGAYCNFNNDTSLVSTYGRLYNWYAVTNPSNLCPPGWHIPSDSEYLVLGAYLGGRDVAGHKMREAGSAHWVFDAGSDNTADNSSGFTALAGGYRNNPPAWANFGYFAIFWTSTQNDPNDPMDAWYHDIFYANADLFQAAAPKSEGFSVRCVKD